MAKTEMKQDQPATPTPAPGGSVPMPKIKRGLKAYYEDVIREMKKVTWPPRAETNRLTGVVLAVCFFIMLLLTSLSYLFDFTFQTLFRGGVR